MYLALVIVDFLDFGWLSPKAIEGCHFSPPDQSIIKLKKRLFNSMNFSQTRISVKVKMAYREFFWLK